jgi:menaquinol-cytochrome c reductase cytochrome b subunit
MISRIKAWTLGVGQTMADWMEERTGIVTMLEEFLYEPVPKRGAWLYTLGSATLFLITLQFLTGILLLFYYVPTADHAWESIYYIMTDVYFGQLIRGIHFWSANILIVVIGLHMCRTFFSGAYKAPREMNWIVGVVLILLVTILAFTGYALRLSDHLSPGGGHGRSGHALQGIRYPRMALAGASGSPHRRSPLPAT